MIGAVPQFWVNSRYISCNQHKDWQNFKGVGLCDFFHFEILRITKVLIGLCAKLCCFVVELISCGNIKYLIPLWFSFRWYWNVYIAGINMQKLTFSKVRRFISDWSLTSGFSCCCCLWWLNSSSKLWYFAAASSSCKK